MRGFPWVHRRGCLPCLPNSLAVWNVPPNTVPERQESQLQEEDPAPRNMTTCLREERQETVLWGRNACACGYAGLVPGSTTSLLLLAPFIFSSLLSRSISFSLFVSISLHLKYKLLCWEENSIPIWLQEILFSLLATLEADGHTLGVTQCILHCTSYTHTRAV